MSRILLALLACLPTLALAATYKCVDAQGHVSYSQTPEAGKRCVEASLPPVQVIPSPPPSRRAAPPAGNEGGAQAAQPKTPDQEIAEAKRALEEARKKLAEQEAVRYGDERNYQKVLDRLKPYQDEVARAEARLKQLQESGSQGVITPPASSGGKY